MKVEFKELPNNNMTYMGLSCNMVKSIVIDEIPVGIVYLSELEKENSIYIEWIEFLNVFQHKHLLRPVMKKLSSEYGKLIFESQEELYKKYNAIGARHTDTDDGREMLLWEYVA